MTQSPSPSPRSSTSTQAPKKLASVERLDILFKIGQMLQANPEMNEVFADSLIAWAAETGSDKTDSEEIWKALRETPIPGPSMHKIMNCLRAVERDLEVTLEKQKRLATNDRGNYGRVMITWQATLALHVFTDEPVEESFGRNQGRIEAYFQKSGEKNPGNLARLERFLAEIREAKRADYIERRDRELAEAEAAKKAVIDAASAALASAVQKRAVQPPRPQAGERASKQAPAPKPGPAVDYDECQPPEGAHNVLSLADQAAASGGRRKAS